MRAEDIQGGVIGPNARVESGTIIARDQINHLVNIYLAAPGRAALNEQEFAAALDRYLGWVEQCYGQLSLRGIERRERQVLSLTLEDVYVSLAATIQPKRNEQKQRRRVKRPELAEQEPSANALAVVDMVELLSLGSRLAIIGGPGSGKTTYLHVIATALARAL